MELTLRRQAIDSQSILLPDNAVNLICVIVSILILFTISLNSLIRVSLITKRANLALRRRSLCSKWYGFIWLDNLDACFFFVNKYVTIVFNISLVFLLLINRAPIATWSRLFTLSYPTAHVLHSRREQVTGCRLFTALPRLLWRSVEFAATRAASRQFLISALALTSRLGRIIDASLHVVVCASLGLGRVAFQRGVLYAYVHYRVVWVILEHLLLLLVWRL